MTRSSTIETRYANALHDRAQEDTSLFGFLNILLRHRRVIVATALLGSAVCIVSSVKEAHYYSTSVLFTAKGGQTNALAGIAAQLGLSIVGEDPTQSIDFYQDLLRTSELLRRVAGREYRVETPKGVVTGTLPVFYGIHARSRDAEIDLAAAKLRPLITTSATRRTGIIGFTVAAPYGALAQQIATNLLSELDRYNAERNHAQVTAERTFIEQRMDESRTALASAENDLTNFRELNREYRTSPRLSIENDRLERAVNMRQDLYTSLAKAYDRARIEEVREGPTLTIVQPPDLPENPDESYGARNILLGTIAGMFAGIVVAFVRERLKENEAAGSATYVAYTDLKRATAEDIRRPWKRLTKPKERITV